MMEELFNELNVTIEDVVNAQDEFVLGRLMADQAAEECEYHSTLAVSFDYWHFGRHAENACDHGMYALAALFSAAWQVRHRVLGHEDAELQMKEKEAIRVEYRGRIVHFHRLVALVAGWKKRVEAALAVLGEEKVLFAASLQDRCAEHAKYHDHTGKECAILAAILEPSAKYDEESLPYYRVRFDDGVELEVGDEELFGRSSAFFGLLTAVSGAFAVARDLGFVGPTHLAKDGSEETIRLFEHTFAVYKIDECAQNFNTPDEFKVAVKSGSVSA
jgi:hypothetical protein